ncbi:MAG: hypothetical protein NUV75_13675, partial [Gallionella sp.]|nr:hypothetical protein [Gallionella sp.]
QYRHVTGCGFPYPMRKQRDIYTSSLDALASVSKQLSLYENQRGMDSETFFDRYQKGLVGDEAESVEWANAYQHYVALQFPFDLQFHCTKLASSRQYGKHGIQTERSCREATPTTEDKTGMDHSCH